MGGRNDKKRKPDNEEEWKNGDMEEGQRIERRKNKGGKVGVGLQ